MASPLPTAKQTVNLAAPGSRGSRIRRDPPPKIKEISIADRNERDRRSVLVGIVMSAAAVIAILVGISSYSGWSPRQYTAHF
jgi:hypothetical protein